MHVRRAVTLYPIGNAPIHSSASTTSHQTPITVVQYPSIANVSKLPINDSSNLYNSDTVDRNSIQNRYGARAIVYTSEKCPGSPSSNNQFWMRYNPPVSFQYDLQKDVDGTPAPFRWINQQIYQNILIHFVPAQYPNSVQQPGYTYYATYGCIAAIAGSASMVLSTQTLLCTMMSCATGVEHSSLTTTAASTAAGALNWVLKDGIGQLGGIIVASYMGQLRSLDSNPKRYRMFAAILLDAAALMELSTPLGVMMVSSSIVVPMACVATLCKNVGFIMASASRATIHQSLCIPTNSRLEHGISSSAAPSTIPNNLADVTAKFASQSTAAGLFGTMFGITLSSWLPAFGTHPDGIFFNLYSVVTILGLVFVHQTCNYMALRSVALYHLNRQRLCIILDGYVRLESFACESSVNTVGEKVLNPIQVAEKEYFLPPWVSLSTSSRNDNNLNWLDIGCPLVSFCPKGSEQLSDLLAACYNERYVLNVDVHSRNNRIKLVFFEEADGTDIIRGMLHAYALRDGLAHHQAGRSETLDEETDLLPLIHRTHQWVQSKFACFVSELRASGWSTNTIFVEEGGNTFRFALRNGKSDDLVKNENDFPPM